ncbi:MAG TPA: AN1-type zinc finger protein [Candidatus Hodarchaeales archaeon]|nr:AN1-type zinc finger protein [Candidatus Hodarchaeales archaeon]
MSEALIFRRLRLLLIPYFLVFGGTTLLFHFQYRSETGAYLYGISLLATFASVSFYRTLFGSTKVKGIDRTYVVGPDLGIIREEKIALMPDLSEAECHECGRKIFKPFRCRDCKEYFCGEHYLQGEHKCHDRENARVFHVHGG